MKEFDSSEKTQIGAYVTRGGQQAAFYAIGEINGTLAIKCIWDIIKAKAISVILELVAGVPWRPEKNNLLVLLKQLMVSNYIQKVILCHNCMRYGHLGKQCKGKPRCAKCKEEHPSNACPNPENEPKCFYC
nr:unnamed protein product [Callosobruchus chinensis]